MLWEKHHCKISTASKHHHVTSFCMVSIVTSVLMQLFILWYMCVCVCARVCVTFTTTYAVASHSLNMSDSYTHIHYIVLQWYRINIAVHRSNYIEWKYHVRFGGFLLNHIRHSILLMTWKLIQMNTLVS